MTEAKGFGCDHGKKSSGTKMKTAEALYLPIQSAKSVKSVVSNSEFRIKKGVGALAVAIGKSTSRCNAIWGIGPKSN